MNQKLSWILVIAGLGLFMYQCGDILANHSTWSDFKQPAGVGELLTCAGGVVLAVVGALGVKLGPANILTRVLGGGAAPSVTPDSTRKLDGGNA